ncbi:hypothetical protein [Agromyces sp. LHK192]|uniref:hypothetical protein n=1 Tax=Agromyces sp. LHK192 TaxID=2498704 RepID=UPI000FDB9B31|nr:hypothetical protein [Agromyces sp. LHK192]
MAFRVPAERLAVARRAQATILALGAVLGVLFLPFGVWIITAGEGAGYLFLALGAVALIAPAVTTSRWRRNLRQAVGVDAVVFAVDRDRLMVGAYGEVPWSSIAAVTFRDERTSVRTSGTAASVGTMYGKKIRDRGGASEMDVLVTLVPAAASHTATLAGDARAMLRDVDGSEVLSLPFGAVLPVEPFHDAYRAVEAVAMSRGVPLTYDDKKERL